MSISNPRRVAAALLAISCAVAGAPSAQAQAKPNIGQFLAPAYPFELVSAKKADRIAWLSYERGVRNVYAASAPDFKPVRLTKFTADDGVTLTALEISEDGSTVVFVRGSEPNTEGWIADPSSNPDGGERAIWAAKTDGSGAWKLTVAAAPSISPDARSVLFARDGQIYHVLVSASKPVKAMDRGEEPFIKLWGRNIGPRWSPDGSKIAFTSERTNHSLVGVYDVKTRTVHYLAPSVDFDAAPIWSPDSKQIAFTRRPGTPFGQQAQGGRDMMGNPPGPGAAAAARAGGAGGRGGRGGQSDSAATAPADGLTRATLQGGYSMALMVADAESGQGREIWHPTAGQPIPPFAAARWEGGNLIFPREDGEWMRYFTMSVSNPGTPAVLTPGEGMLETSAVSGDGRTFYYGSNVGDIDRRHVWKVPVAGGPAVQITTGSEIEMSPAPLASGKLLAVLTSSGTRPMSVGIVPVSGGAKKLIFPTFAKDFPFAASVEPQNVQLKAADGIEFHTQLFLPKDIKPGEKRPAIVFVHGGPPRQMLLGYHYMDFYHTAYGVNEWLQAQGYIVISVNYRLGIGYGRTFQRAANAGIAGNSEYGDVLAAGKYLQSRPDVDPSRVGIWGLSYGGVLTAQALARNSDIFAAGVDMAGVHLWGNSLDTSTVSYKASAISAIDKWRSPVLVWQGDDDRNVAFSQTIGLVQLLRAHNVPHELIVIPDDTHETLIHQRWLTTFDRMQDFLQRNLWNRSSRPTP
jgi:dipeptidyl aminopeptidase/acylaminoacyl peptidase